MVSLLGLEREGEDALAGMEMTIPTMIPQINRYDFKLRLLSILFFLFLLIKFFHLLGGQ